VIGEFQEVRGFVLESIRSDVVQAGSEELPQNWQELHDKRRDQLAKTGAQGAAGRSPILSRLLSLPTNAATNYVARRSLSFSVTLESSRRCWRRTSRGRNSQIYDYRLEKIQRERGEKFRSVRYDLRLESAPGLQIADILAGEVRNWFLANAGFLDLNSGTTLAISDTSNNTPNENQGRLYRKTRTSH